MGEVEGGGGGGSGGKGGFCADTLYCESCANVKSTKIFIKFLFMLSLYIVISLSQHKFLLRQFASHIFFYSWGYPTTIFLVCSLNHFCSNIDFVF